MLSHFPKFVEEPIQAMNYIKKAIREMEKKNWEPVYGLLEGKEMVKFMLESQKKRIGINYENWK
jgi:hypothetical protein